MCECARVCICVCGWHQLGAGMLINVRYGHANTFTCMLCALLVSANNPNYCTNVHKWVDTPTMLKETLHPPMESSALLNAQPNKYTPNPFRSLSELAVICKFVCTYQCMYSEEQNICANFLDSFSYCAIPNRNSLYLNKSNVHVWRLYSPSISMIFGFSLYLYIFLKNVNKIRAVECFLDRFLGRNIRSEKSVIYLP